MAQYEGIKMVHREITLSTSAYVVCPDENTEGLIINTGKIVIPSTIVVTVQYSNNGTTWVNLSVSATNTEVPLDGKNYKFIRIIKISGATSEVVAVYGQGGGGGGGTFDASTGAQLVYDLSAPVAENNADGVIHTSDKLLATATDAYTTDVSAGLEASSVSRASSGRFFGIRGFIDKSAPNAEYFIHVVNASSLPADGAVTFLCDPIPVSHTTNTTAATRFEHMLDRNGVYGSLGVLWYISSTRDTKTITAAYVRATAYVK